MEHWKYIEGYEGLYKISDQGNVFSEKRNKKMTNNRNQKGYLYVCLRSNNIRKCYLVHRLVAKSFIENNEEKPQVNHIDGDKENNKVENLEWVTNSENQKHAFKNGLKETTRKAIGKTGKSTFHKAVQANKKTVQQLTMSGELISEFESSREAGRHLGDYKKQSGISQCCNGKRNSAYGYKWIYKS